MKMLYNNYDFVIMLYNNFAMTAFYNDNALTSYAIFYV